MRVLHQLICLSAANAFVVDHERAPSECKMNPSDLRDDNKSGRLGGFFDMFQNFDDIVDDFFYKRMGKGEIFYGKRKYKPSGDVEGEYNGFGLSDKLKIDMTREYKEEWLEEKRMRDEIKKLKEEKEKRNSF